MVTDRKLRLCLDNLRPAVEGLWQPAAPRIVQDFTDHGIEHYERIATYAGNLLASKAPNTAPLSAVEMFLLVAGIYLHDVGMQCDVTTPDGKEIKYKAQALGTQVEKVAPGLGANFGGVEFTATGANRYSLDEQKTIRKNHHFLSAAWIEYAHETGRTVLGSAAQQIPSELVEDLMDVCLHHTSIPIEHCPSRLAGGGAGRKRLVAALLRFADELDIASNRVDMAAVTQFGVPPENAAYWWLHNLTEVTFDSPNTFRVTVRLRKDEADEFTPLVRSFYLEKFERKNWNTLQVLKDFGFPVGLDAYSGVVPLRLGTSIPVPIKAALRGLVRGTGSSDLGKATLDGTTPAGTADPRRSGATNGLRQADLHARIFSSKQLRVGCLSWPPIVSCEWNDGEYEARGLYGRWIRAIASRNGLALKCQTVGWQNIETLLRRHEIDMVFGAFITERRRRYADFTKPFHQCAMNGAVSKRDTRNWDIDTIRNPHVRVALVKNEVGFEFARRVFYTPEGDQTRFHLIETPTVESIVGDVLYGTADVAIADAVSIRSAVTKHARKLRVVFDDPPIGTFDVAVMVPKGQGNVVKWIEGEVKDLRETPDVKEEEKSIRQQLKGVFRAL